MEELIRARIHDALAVEQPPPGLRSRVIAAVPIDAAGSRSLRRPAFRAQWASGFAAVLVTVALVAALVFARFGDQLGLTNHATPASPTRLIAPEGLAVAPDGTIYVSDYVGNRVYRLQQNGSLVTVAGGGSAYEGPATRSNLYTPTGLAVATNGDLYIADNLGGVVRRVDGSGMLTTFWTIHGAGQNLNSPVGLAFDRSGRLFVGEFGGGVVVLRSGTPLSTIDLSGIGAPPPNPGYLAFDAAGNLYVGDRSPYPLTVPDQVPTPPGGCRIIRVAADGSVSVIAGTGTCGYSGDGGPASLAQLDDPNGIAFDAAGNLYFADTNNHRIRRIDRQGIITTVAGTAGEGHTGDGGKAVKAALAYPAGLAMVNGRYLYVSDGCGCTDPAAFGAVRVIDLRNGIITTAVSSSSRVVS